MSSEEVRFNPKISAAIRARDLSALRALLEADPEQVKTYTPFAGGTWLHFAAREGDVDAVRHLLSLGADPNAGDIREGRSSLCDACLGDHASIVRLLIEAGASIDTTEPVRNPLFSAIVGRSAASVKLLLAQGIDTKIAYSGSNMERMDSVAFAIERGETEIAETIARWDSPAGYERRLEDARYVAAINNVR